MATNKYEDMNIFEVLERINNHTMLLPDIQREYVWKPEDVENLFESIVDNYPVGSCIFWKTTKENINKQKPNLYYFINNFKERETKNEKAPEVINKDDNYYIVLDGQQRITSINIALRGSIKIKRKGKGFAYNNPNSWREKELYFNLDYYNLNEKDEENPPKRFCFLTDEEANSGNYYKIKNIIGYDKFSDFVISIDNLKGTKYFDDLIILYQRLQNENGNGVIHYYCINEENYDNALNIFVRINSTGKKLSKTDLLFSTLINGWQTGKKDVEDTIQIMNCKGDGFKFTKDYIMRASLVLVDKDTSLKITSLTNEIILKIRNNWKKINYTMDKLSTLLSDIGMCDERLTSYNATIPIAYYIYNGGKIKEKEAKEEVKKFLAISMTNGLFGVASNDALNKTRQALQKIDCSKVEFSVKLFEDLVLTGNRTFKVDLSNIEYWLDTFEKGNNTYILLSLLYPTLKLSKDEYHQDHCHPEVAFKNKCILKLNLTEDKQKEWKKMGNLLPNLQFLEGKENESKNKIPLKKWVEELGNDFKYHPEGVSLEFKDFEDFFKKRREKMLQELKIVFGVDK